MSCCYIWTSNIRPPAQDAKRRLASCPSAVALTDLLAVASRSHRYSFSPTLLMLRRLPMRLQLNATSSRNTAPAEHWGGLIST